MKRITILFLIISITILLLGCNSIKTNDSTMEETSVENNDESTQDIDIIIDSYYSEDFTLPMFESTSSVEYISRDERESWREALIIALSKLQPYNEYYEYECPDDQLPKATLTGVKWGSDGVALIDVNFDGIPEVAEWWNDGGSAGNSGFQIFDLYSGEQVAGISTGWWRKPVMTVNDRGEEIQIIGDDGTSYGEWCTYIDDEGNYKIFGQYNYGSGNMEHYFSKMEQCADSFYGTEYVYRYLHRYEYTSQEIDGGRVSVIADYGFFFYNSYNKESRVTAQEVKEYFADLLSRYKIIEETEMTVFLWEDIEGYGELSQEELAEKMADVLISSEQQFIIPKNN